MVHRRVFPELDQVGVISQPADTYRGKRWWTSSEGFKTVVTETLSLAYEWLFD